MQFHSLKFLIFFPIVVLLYFIIPKKLKTVWLLLASYYFYMSWNIKHTVLIACSTMITWVCGILLGKCPRAGKRAKSIAAAGIVSNLAILFFFKYFDFFIYNLNIIRTKLGASAIEKPFALLLPVGISFYTFQALGYLIDVYRGHIKPEKNICNYALFVSFFPQLVAGPIERSRNLLHQIHQIRKTTFHTLFNYERIAQGLVLMLWGFFQKLVIADRLAILVDRVYDAWYFYGSTELLVATAAFSIQIYCDFASYSTIAAGAAKVMGFSLMENFRTPYFSKSIREFWRRWHISLSTWFKDYLYIPLGGSRCHTLRRHFNLFFTFLVSGLWHGASWHYIVWGALHGCYQMIGIQTEPLRKKWIKKAGIHTKSFSYRLGQILVTYLLTLLGLIFFRSDSLTTAFGILKRIFTKPNVWALTDGTLYQLGLEHAEINVLFAALMILFLVSILREYKKETLDLFLSRQTIWFRWLVIIILFSFIFLFGMYGPDYDESQFIYFQF